MPTGRNAGTTTLANAPPTTGASCVCHAPSQLPKALQPGGMVCRAPRGALRFPFPVGRGRKLGTDHEDIQCHDFPRVGPNLEPILCAYRLRDDTTLVGEMTLVLGNLAGEEGVKAVERFVHGKGAKVTHGPGSPISRMAARSWQFLANLLTVTMRIRAGVKTLSLGGIEPDFSALRVALPATHWGLRDFPVKAGDPEGAALKAIIGGTQGESLYATSLVHDPVRRSYELGLRWVILDHFGVSREDLYAPGLFAFFILQHEREGYRPYVNEVVIETAVRSTY